MTLRDTYNDLITKYAFNPGDLRERFLNVADTVFYGSNVYMKEFNLLMFRMHNPNLPLPELFYSYSFDESQDIETSSYLRDFLKRLYTNKPEDVNFTYNFSISRVLRDGFNFNTPALQLQLSPKIQHFTPKDRQIVGKDKEIIYTHENRYPFVIDYFCTSTFPAAFAHFVSKEFLLAGYNFIKQHINDKLAPRLVGTYLLHSCLFNDRLFSTFFKMIVKPLMQESDADDVFTPEYDDEMPDDKEEEIERLFKDKKCLTNQRLLSCLYDSFSQCISYFSDFHPKVVNLLREKNENDAIIAVTNYFLYELISLWKYSPTYNYTCIFNKTSTLKNPDVFHEIYSHNILDDLAQSICSNKAFALKILDLFVDDSLGFTEVPEISQVKFFNGVSFCITQADMSIMQCIILAEEKDKAIFHAKDSRTKSLNVNQKYQFKAVKNVRDFINQMFLLRNSYKQYITPDFNEPVSKVLSTKLSEEKLKENQAYLNFLIERMKGMKLLQISMDSSFELLKLKERQYASKIWNGARNTTPEYFIRNLLTQFCWTLFTGQVNYCEKHVQTLIQKENEFYSYFINSIDEQHFSSSNISLTKFIFDKVANYFKILRANANDLSANEISFKENIIECSKYLLSEIQRVSFELFLNMMNETACPFIETEISIHSKKPFDQFRNEKIQNFLKISTFSVSPELIEENGFENDFIIKGSGLIRIIVGLADEEMKKEVDQWITEKFKIGDKLLLFLMLKDFIAKSLEKTDFKDLKTYAPGILSNGDYNYDYLRCNLINCISIFTKIFADKKKWSFFPMTTEIVESLEYLRTAFDINDDSK